MGKVKPQEILGGRWDKIVCPGALLEAVICVQDSITERAGSDDFGSNPRFFEKHALFLVVSEWSRITGLDSSLFPYEIGFVMNTWVTYRKCPQPKKDRLCQELGLLIG
jgi:hypothetical protein